MDWCTIESDPGVFTELIEQIGVKGVQVEELWSLDPELLNEHKPIYGLIFLFKWTGEKDQRPTLEDYEHNIFFAKQVINNACATQAILSILMNLPDIELGPELTDFKSFTKELPSEMKGLAIGNSELIKKVHNSFARQEPFVIEQDNSEAEDAFHFISYVPVNGALYELDGLKKGPINLGACSNENWLDQVRPIIQQRIEQYSDKEIRFTLLAIVANRLQAARAQLSALESERASLSDAMQVEGSQDRRAVIDAELVKLQDVIATEEAKVKRYKLENARRRHNFVPFLFNFLKVLAEKQQLQPLIEHAKNKQAQRAQAKK
jgi:ubiquitin carboxyl-terminal hydrolase L5